MNEVNVSDTVGMFATVGEMSVTGGGGGYVRNSGGDMSATMGGCPQPWGNVRNSGGDVHNSGWMSATVGECPQQWGMSTTVAEMSATVGKLNMI